MTNLLLINEIKKDNFKPELFGGYIVDDINFIKSFQFGGSELSEVFEDINYFLINNGYNKLDFDNWSIDGIENELMSVYGDPDCNGENKALILVIYRLEFIKNNKIINNQDNNKQRKLPIPKHLSDKEKRNLMIAWARTHNKIDREAGTITYPSGKVGKLKPKKENNKDLQEKSTKEYKIYHNKAVRVISIYIEAGVYRLSDIMEDAFEKFGGISNELFDAIKQGYASFRETADDDTYAKLDKKTRHYKYETLIQKIKNDEQDNNQQNKEYQIQLEHYSQIVKDHLKAHHKSFFKSLVRENELNRVALNRATLFLEQLEMSNNPQQDKEIYFQQMLEF